MNIQIRLDPPALNIAIGIALDMQGRTLLTQRKADSHLGGLWEWPGGKVRREEHPHEAVRREWREEVGGDLAQAVPYDRFTHAYPDRTVLLHFFLVEPSSPHTDPLPTIDNPALSADGRPLIWHRIDRIQELPFPDGNWDVLKRLCQEWTGDH